MKIAGRHGEILSSLHLPATFAAFWAPLAGLEIDSVGHNVLQFHQLQLDGCCGAGSTSGLTESGPAIQIWDYL